MIELMKARVAARHEEHEVTIGNSRTRIRHSLPVHSAPLVLSNGNTGSISSGLLMSNEEADEESSYLEPIRLQGPNQQQMWSSSTYSRPLSSSSLISSNSSPMSPAAAAAAATSVAGVYANNETLMASHPHPHPYSHLHPLESSLEAVAVNIEPVLPPPVAYANQHNSYPKLDELSDEHDSHLYINVGPDAVEVNTSISPFNQKNQLN